MIHDGVLATLCAPALAVAIQRSDEGWGFRPMSHASGMGRANPRALISNQKMSV